MIFLNIVRLSDPMFKINVRPVYKIKTAFLTVSNQVDSLTETKSKESLDRQQAQSQSQVGLVGWLDPGIVRQQISSRLSILCPLRGRQIKVQMIWQLLEN